MAPPAMRSAGWRGRASIVAGGALALALASHADGDGWERVFSAGDLTIDARTRPGSAIKEVRAEGVVGAPPHVVRAVLADVERYPEFMPYVTISSVLAREPAGVLVYQRLSFGALRLLGLRDRDYVLRIVERIAMAPDGRPTYKRAWAAIDGAGPPVLSSVVRLATNRGFWELRAAGDDGAQTAAMYCLFTDPGGALPAWVVNEANTSGVPKVFAAVRTAVMDRRYATEAPPEAPETPAADPSIDIGLCDEQ